MKSLYEQIRGTYSKVGDVYLHRIIKRVLLQESNRPDTAGQSFGAASRHGRSEKAYP